MEKESANNLQITEENTIAGRKISVNIKKMDWRCRWEIHFLLYFLNLWIFNDSLCQIQSAAQ